jgi:hypothetical protein
MLGYNTPDGLSDDEWANPVQPAEETDDGNQSKTWLDAALDDVVGYERQGDEQNALAARAALKEKVRERWIAEGESWIEPYPLDVFPEVEWDTLDENGRDQAQRNAAHMARHIGKRIIERADALMSEPDDD